VAGGEEVGPDLLGEESEEREVVPLEHVAHEARDHASAHRSRGAELLGDHAGRRDGVVRDGGHRCRVLISITHTSLRASALEYASRPPPDPHTPVERAPWGNFTSCWGAPPSTGMRQKIVPPVES